MLAVVVIGADDTVRETFEAWTKEGATVRFYDTAEEAHYDLVDAEATESAKLRELATAAREAGSLPSEAAAGALQRVADEREPSMITRDEADRWACSVVYGPETFGLFVSGQPTKLQHSGWTLVAMPNIPDRTQHDPRRVEDGRLTGAEPETMVFQAATMAGANLILDVTRRDAVETVRRQMVDRVAP